MAKRTTSRKTSGKNNAGWTRRALGLVLCAFFAMGVATGLSQAGRSLASRLRTALGLYVSELSGTFLSRPGHPAHGAMIAPLAPSGGPVALVERRDGFYALFAQGELRGPVEPAGQGDLPILSGARAETAGGADLVRYAGLMVRAEAELAGLLSEMRINSDGTVSLFFDRSHTQLRLNFSDAPAELRRAAEVLNRWRGHRRLIALLDMTTPGQAVMRLHGLKPGESAKGSGAVRRIADLIAAAGGGPRLAGDGIGSARR